MRPRAFAAVVIASGSLWTAGCSPPPPCSSIGVPGPAPVPFGQLEKYWIADPDHDIGVDVSLPASGGGFGPGSCTPPPDATSVRVEVSDPLNADLQPQSTLTSRNPPSARISFRAAVAGRYHVYVIFEPNLGSAQTDALVVRDARKAQLRAFTERCQTVQQLANGALLCASEVSDTSGFAHDQPVLIRPDESRVQLVANASYAVSGDVLWEYTKTGVRRLVDSGAGAPPPSATLAMPNAPENVHQLLASDTELLVLTDTELQRFLFDGAAIRAAGDATFASGAKVMIRSADAIFVINDTGTGAPQSQKFNVAGDMLTGDVGTVTLSGLVRGVDAKGVWLGPNDAAEASGTSFSGSMSYLAVDSDGMLRSQIVFGMPGGYTAREPTGLSPGFGRHPSFTGGVAGIVPAASSNNFGGSTATAAAIFLPRFDGKNVALDLVTESAGANIRFGQSGDLIWVGEENTATATKVLQRGQ